MKLGRGTGGAFCIACSHQSAGLFLIQSIWVEKRPFLYPGYVCAVCINLGDIHPSFFVISISTTVFLLQALLSPEPFIL